MFWEQTDNLNKHRDTTTYNWVLQIVVFFRFGGPTKDPSLLKTNDAYV